MTSEPATLARLSVSLPAEVLQHLDRMVEERALPSRSHLITQLIRHELAEHQAEVRPDETLAGTITLVYRGAKGSTREHLASTQHDFLKEVISSQHIFLEDDQSLEVLLVQGPAARLEALCDALRCIRGVQQLELVTTTALLPPLHEQDGESEERTSRVAEKAA